MELFDQAGIQHLRKASRGTVQYLYDALSSSEKIKILTPKNPEERGSQLSLLVEEDGRQLFDHLTNQGVIADWREPNVIRIAAAPLYNTLEDIEQCVSLIESPQRKIPSASP